MSLKDYYIVLIHILYLRQKERMVGEREREKSESENWEYVCNTILSMDTLHHSCIFSLLVQTEPRKSKAKKKLTHAIAVFFYYCSSAHKTFMIVCVLSTYIVKLTQKSTHKRYRTRYRKKRALEPFTAWIAISILSIAYRMQNSKTPVHFGMSIWFSFSLDGFSTRFSLDFFNVAAAAAAKKKSRPTNQTI